MTSEATTQESGTQLRNGWLGSLVLHGLLLFSLFPLFRLSPLTVPKELFHWDVTLVESTQPMSEPVQSVGALEPTVASFPKSAPMPARSVRTVRHAAPSADQTVPIEPQITEPIAPTSQPRIASSVATASETATASMSEKPAPIQPQASDPPPQQADRPANLTTAEPSTPQTAAAAVNETSAPPSDVPLPSSPPAAGSNPETTAPRPDYGWLQQAIFQRLEELKRSSRPFLDQSQPFKVMVKAVVSREGMLLDSVVVKSSGLDRIDQEAMALVQRAFPMQFERTLDQQQIVMRIPITYSRE